MPRPPPPGGHSVVWPATRLRVEAALSRRRQRLVSCCSCCCLSTGLSAQSSPSSPTRVPHVCSELASGAPLVRRHVWVWTLLSPAPPLGSFFPSDPLGGAGSVFSPAGSRQGERPVGRLHPRSQTPASTRPARGQDLLWGQRLAV